MRHVDVLELMERDEAWMLLAVPVHVGLRFEFRLLSLGGSDLQVSG